MLPPGKFHFRDGFHSSITDECTARSLARTGLPSVFVALLARIPVCLPTVDGAALRQGGVDIGVRDDLHGDRGREMSCPQQRAHHDETRRGRESKARPYVGSDYQCLEETNQSGSQATPHGGVGSDFVAHIVNDNFG